MATREERASIIGARIDHEIKRREWTGADLSRAIRRAGGKTTPGDISRWIRGVVVPSPASIEKIADALFLDTDELLTLAGYKPRLPKDQLDKFHALADPYAKYLDWDDPEVQIAIVGALEQQLQIKELRKQKRTQETFFTPVEVDEED